MLASIFYAAVIALLTSLSGLALTPGKLRPAAKIALSYAVGFSMLSLAGLLSAAIGGSVFAVQLMVFLVSAGYVVRYKRLPGKLEKADKKALLVSSVAVIIFTCLLSQIPTWMAGDTLERAIEIRMFLEGEDIPVSVFPFGSYWAQYPKAFQAYTFFWVKLLGVEITEALKIIPILMSVYAPLGLYAIVREHGEKNAALYALAISCFGFIPHTAMFVWGGYTTLAGEMMLVAVILALIVEKRLLPILVGGLLFSHPRLLFFTVLIIGAWQSIHMMGAKRKLGVLGVMVLFVMVLAIGSMLYKTSYSVKTPTETKSIIEAKTIDLDFALTWFFGLTAGFGLLYGIKRRSKLDILVIAWIISLTALALIVDLGVISRHRLSIDRILTELYLPLSVLGGYVFVILDRKLKLRNGGFVLLSGIIVFGILASYMFVSGYYEPWSLPKPDYNAFTWLGEQGYDNTLLINLDSTGMWAYPISGIELVDPFMFTYNPPQYVKELAANASSENSLDDIEGLSQGYGRTLVYVSSV
ncbi:hypothetical protein KKG41_07175 [Patescibacteria group bacterium]|nr:hypothetical protein [Patescibacteria group bacterium]